MSTFANEIASGLRERGHRVQECTAPMLLSRLAFPKDSIRKWLGYVDQFVLFPPLLWFRVRFLPDDAICVLADQALGPWLFCFKDRPHVVHVHDFLALEGALGKEPFHQVGITGQFYQRFIRTGFRKARFFLPDSTASSIALHNHLLVRPLLAEVLYPPLLNRFRPMPEAQSAAALRLINLQLARPFLFHIGVNWYKNRQGVLSIWEQLFRLGTQIDLILVGALEPQLKSWIDKRPLLKSRLKVLVSPGDHIVVSLYNKASALLFPSHAEGFGWPILEAMACGCPVITTDKAPMNEVAGQAATLIPQAPLEPDDNRLWARQSALLVQEVLHRSPMARQDARERGFQQSRRFERSQWLDRLEGYYQRALVLQQHL